MSSNIARYQSKGVFNSTYYNFQFLNVEQGNQHTVMCLECWHHISDFHNFRHSVILAQAKLLKDDPAVESPTDKYSDHFTATNDVIDNNIVIKQEADLISLSDNEMETNKMPYDVIVKEEEFIPSPQEAEYVQSTEKCPPEYDNIFVTDEAELISLVKSTPKITFTKCNTEPLSLEDSQVTTDRLDAKSSKDLITHSSSSIQQDTGNSFYKNETDKLSENNGYPIDNSEDDELMDDISEYEFDSLDENDTSDDDESLNSNTKVKGSKQIDNEKGPPAHNTSTNSVSKTRSIKRKREEELDDIIAQWRSKLECIFCNETFTSYTLLQEHFCLNHPSKECYIQCCDIKLKRRGHLAEHVRLHVDPNAFKCKYCSKRCTRKRNLNYHMLKQHGIDTTKDECFEQDHANVSSSKNLEATTPTEEDDIPKESRVKKSLIHVRKESESQPHRKLAVQESDDLIAQWFPILECNVCKEQCSNFSLLHGHFRKKHPTGDGYVLCCQRKFSRRSKFQDHIRLHLDPKAFACTLCGKSFATRCNLDYHMNNIHYNSKDDNINNVKALKKNLRNTSEAKTESPNNKSNKRKTVQELDDIIAQWRPNLECVVCKETRTNFALLQQHFHEMHPDESCYITCCQLKFTGRHDIEEHIRLHNDPNAFMCEFCTKCFTSRRNLNRHLRTKHRS